MLKSLIIQASILAVFDRYHESVSFKSLKHLVVLPRVCLILSGTLIQFLNHVIKKDGRLSDTQELKNE